MIKIELLLPEKVSTNRIYAGMHWSKRLKLAELYHSELMPFRSKKDKSIQYPVDITYVFEFKSKPLDTSNCTFMVKLLEDGLRVNGLIEDDSPEFVSSTHIYSQKGSKDKVVIYIA